MERRESPREAEMLDSADMVVSCAVASNKGETDTGALWSMLMYSWERDREGRRQHDGVSSQGSKDVRGVVPTKDKKLCTENSSGREM